MSNEKRLIREYVKILLEDEGGGGGSGESSGPATFDTGPGFFGTGSYSGAGATRSALVSPIADVMKIIKGKAKELFRSAWYVAEFALKTLLSALTIGLYDAKYDSIHQSYLGSMSKIRSQYSQAVSDSIQAFLRNDVMSAAFFYNPGLYMTGKIATAFAEGRVLFEEESKGSEAKIIKSGRSVARPVVDEYFADLESSLQQLASAKTLEDLEVDPQVYSRARKDLDAIPNEIERRKAEEELIKASKLQIFTDEMKKLKSERESIIKGMQEIGVPLDKIMHPEGLAARYEREMRRLSTIKL